MKLFASWKPIRWTGHNGVVAFVMWIVCFGVTPGLVAYKMGKGKTGLIL